MSGIVDFTGKPIRTEQPVGHVLVTLLNVCSSVEIQLKNFLEGKPNTIFNTKSPVKTQTNKTSEAEAYIFGPVMLPPPLNEDLFGILSIIKYNADGVDNYLMSIDIREQTGNKFCSYEAYTTESVFEDSKAVYLKLKSEP